MKEYKFESGKVFKVQKNGVDIDAVWNYFYSFEMAMRYFRDLNRSLADEYSIIERHTVEKVYVFDYNESLL